MVCCVGNRAGGHACEDSKQRKMLNAQMVGGGGVRHVRHQIRKRKQRQLRLDLHMQFSWRSIRNHITNTMEPGTKSILRTARSFRPLSRLARPSSQRRFSSLPPFTPPQHNASPARPHAAPAGPTAAMPMPFVTETVVRNTRALTTSTNTS